MTIVPLTVARNAIAETYAAMLALCSVTLPLRAHPEPTETGVVIDASGREVFVVDANGERSDAEVASLAALIADAVNAQAGAEPA